jgi:ATP-dependent RNA helicase DDX23/PRP28
MAKRSNDEKLAYDRFTTGRAEDEKRREARRQREEEERARERRQREDNKKADEFDHELNAIRNHYLGIKEEKKKIIKPSEKFARIFQFDWEETDDTSRNDKNPLYNNRMHLNPMFGRGYIAGIDLREQRKDSKFLELLSVKRMAESRAIEEKDDKLTTAEKDERARARALAMSLIKERQSEEMKVLDEFSMGKSTNTHWSF